MIKVLTDRGIGLALYFGDHGGYTVMADGSIEAKLPQGTIRFASLAELRAHIESNS